LELPRNNKTISFQFFTKFSHLGAAQTWNGFEVENGRKVAESKSTMPPGDDGAQACREISAANSNLYLIGKTNSNTQANAPNNEHRQVLSGSN
jgi:hypothetical protein